MANLGGTALTRADLLDENDIEIDEEIIIKRSLSKDGKNKIFINDQAISVKLLKEIGKFLVEVHGQFDNHGLLNPANHLDVLDKFANYPELLSSTKKSFEDFKNIKNKRQKSEADILKA